MWPSPGPQVYNHIVSHAGMDKAAASQHDRRSTIRSHRIDTVPGKVRGRTLGVAQATCQKKQRNKKQNAFEGSAHDHKRLGQLVLAAEAALSEEGASEEVKPVVGELIAGSMQCLAGGGRPPDAVVPDAAQPEDRQQRRRRKRQEHSARQVAKIYECAEAALAYEDASESLRQRSSFLDTDLKLYAERTEALVQKHRQIDALQDTILSAAVADKEMYKSQLRALMDGTRELELKQQEARVNCEYEEIHARDARSELAKARARIHNLVTNVSLKVRRKGVTSPPGFCPPTGRLSML